MRYHTIIKFFIVIPFFCIYGFLAAADMPKMPPTLVDAIKAVAIQTQPQIQATGTLVAEQGVTIKPDISGRITQIFFKSGQYVKQGDPLIQIYPDILKAELNANEATLKLAQLTLNRYADLIKQKAISTSDYDTAASNLSKAQAGVEQTKAQLNQTLVTAPFGGYLGISKVSLGDYVTTGQPLVNLQDTDPMYVDFPVPEVYSKQIAVNQKITINSNAYGNKSFVGNVMAVESLIDPATRTLGVRAQVPNQNHALIPGSFVEVNVFIGQSNNVLSIPQTALLYSAKGPYVFKIVNNKAQQTYVTLGLRGDNNVYITKGLTAGDWVVTAGQQKIADGAPVKIK